MTTPLAVLKAVMCALAGAVCTLISLKVAGDTAPGLMLDVLLCTIFVLGVVVFDTWADRRRSGR